MARQCHANTCPVGIATQRPDLRAGFAGTADMLVGYLRLVATEVRTILASQGMRALGDLVGRVDLLRRREGVKESVTLANLLAHARLKPRAPAAGMDEASAERAAIQISDFRPDRRLVASGPIANTDRAFGADIAGEIAARHGDSGLPDGTVDLTVTGSAGQSFGAFALPGMRLVLVGDANDGLGKGMHGGEIVVAPSARERGRRGQVLVGNAALYGATGGRVFIAGAAGERFAVRNSGAVAVVEGVGDHGCEYMTGGIVVVLGPVGRNFAAGMTGGVVYVLDSQRPVLQTKVDTLAIDVPTPSELAMLRDLLSSHARLTGSRVAHAILWHDRSLSALRRLAPVAADEATAALRQVKAVNE